MKTVQFLLLIFLTASIGFGEMRDEDGYTKKDVQRKIESFTIYELPGLYCLALGLRQLVQV